MRSSLSSRIPDRVADAVAPSASGVWPEDDPLTLPPAWAPPPRPALPLVAAIVPVVGAVALWLVTGWVMSLWLALLGPLVAFATMLDARRGVRRDRRRAADEAARARDRVSAEVDRRHEAERARLGARHPDVARFLARGDDIWRGAAATLVAGDGEIASAVRIAGGEGDPDAADLRRRAARLRDAPVAIPAAEGVAVVGEGVVADGVQRALALQLCLSMPPGELRIAGPIRGHSAWAAALPHAVATAGAALALVGPGEPVPADADIAIARCRPGDPLPPRCAAVITVAAPRSARLERLGESLPLRAEAVGAAQAEAIAQELAARAERALGLAPGRPEPVLLASLTPARPAPGRAGLPAVIGVAGGEPVVVDLVADGPHAVVAGVTGSGKSELLITWVLALCATHSPEEVSFLLADFKGGTAFDGLSGVPHVTGVITDLDGAGARRAIESLRAELRRRERAIARAGARDILDPGVRLARLVVIVDEFAALLGDHPELHALFADVAARGRALGIHLVLGTQRAAGVIRENLLANCPLRLSLRVTDPADSRALLGSDEAARLPGGAAGRGCALVRRAGDVAPERLRVALSGSGDLAAAVARGGGAESERPWLPDLPRRIELDELSARSAAEGAPEVPRVLLGLADEPDRQRQPVVGLARAAQGAGESLLVLGGPGSGVTNVLDLVSAQASGEVVRLPDDAEGWWDAVADLAARPLAAGAVVIADDLDALGTRLPAEYLQVGVERLEGVVRAARAAGALVVMGAHRLIGPASRLADLFAQRLVLPFPSRAEHAAAGADPSTFDPNAGPGRGILAGRVVQVALAPVDPGAPASPAPGPGAGSPPWHPTAALTGFVARRSPAARRAVAAWESEGSRVASLDDYAAHPSVGPAGRLVLVGEPDDWQRHWRLLADVRGDHDLVVDASCAAELRVLAGVRGVPPYCEPGRGRAWLISAGDDPVRIVLPDADLPPDRRGALS